MNIKGVVDGNPFAVSIGYLMVYAIRLLLYLPLLLLCGCASSRVYVNPSEIDGLGAVVEFPSGRIKPINIESVFSGSRIRLTNNETVVYIGLSIPDLYNIPESARSLNEQLLGSNDMRLEFDTLKRDSRGDLLAYLFTPDGRLINAELVRAGMARVLITPPNTRYKDRLLRAEAQARKNKKGLWSRDFGDNIKDGG